MYHPHYSIDAATVAFPHGPEARLSTDVPDLDGDVTLCYLAHVEAHRGDHVLAELTRLWRERTGVSKVTEGCVEVKHMAAT